MGRSDSSESNVPIYHETHRGRMLFAAHISKNFIEKIEGLDKLTKLTDLSFFSNRIKELSGLENLHELNVLSFG